MQTYRFTGVESSQETRVYTAKDLGGTTKVEVSPAGIMSGSVALGPAQDTSAESRTLCQGPSDHVVGW